MRESVSACSTQKQYRLPADGLQQLVRSLRAVMAAWLLGAAVVGQAQVVRPGNETPAALDRVQPVGACRKDDSAPATGGGPLAAVPVWPPDLSCALPVADAAAGLARGAFTLVDVRSSSEHEQARIEPSMHMALGDLRTMDFLRRKPLVLVGNGKAERELYAACARLRSAGFVQVHVLRGGLAQWRLEGHAVVAREPAEPASPRLTTAQLWAESQFEANLVLATPAQARLREQLPLALPIPDLQAATLKAVLKRRSRELSGAPLAAVVLVVEPGTADDALHRARLALGAVPLLVYAQPLDQYMRDMAQQRAMWAGHARGPRQPPCVP